MLGWIVRMGEEKQSNFTKRNEINDDMSGLTENTLARIDKWLSYGTSMEAAFPKLEQRYRMQICSEFYKRWVQNKDIDPRTVCRNIARRDYEMFFNQAAQGNKEGCWDGLSVWGRKNKVTLPREMK